MKIGEQVKDPRKQVPCPWDPNATCPESPKRSIEFKDYGDMIIIRWFKNGQIGTGIIMDPKAIEVLQKTILDRIPDNEGR